MMKPISAAILNIRGAAPALPLSEMAQLTQPKILLGQLILLIIFHRLSKKVVSCQLRERKASTNRLACICWDNCYSADKREPNSFKKEDIDKANRNAGFFERMVFGERDTFIERVANEIWSRGYTDVKVSGYHGAGVFYAGEIPFTHLRSTTIPPTITVKESP